MGKWTILLGGLAIWAAHFFLLYGFASIWPGHHLARWLAGAATLAALAADAALIVALLRRRRSGGDDFDRWMIDGGLLGAFLSTVSVAWQGLPALLS